MLPQEDQESCIVSVPARSVKVAEKGIGRIDGLDVFTVQTLWQHSDTLETCLGLLGCAWEGRSVSVNIQTVRCRYEHGTRGEHDGRVVGKVLMVESDEVVDELIHERMPFGRDDNVIGNADRNGLWQDDLESQKRVEATETANVKIHVDTTVVMKHKVANGVCALNGIRIAIKDGQEPIVVLCDEFARVCVGPELVFVVWVHGLTLVTNSLPSWWKMLVLPSLVDDAWNLFLWTAGVPWFRRIVSPWLGFCDNVGAGVDVGMRRRVGSRVGVGVGHLCEPWDTCSPAIRPIWRFTGADLVPCSQLFWQNVGG